MQPADKLMCPRQPVFPESQSSQRASLPRQPVFPDSQCSQGPCRQGRQCSNSSCAWIFPSNPVVAPAQIPASVWWELEIEYVLILSLWSVKLKQNRDNMHRGGTKLSVPFFFLFTEHETSFNANDKEFNSLSQGLAVWPVRWHRFVRVGTLDVFNTEYYVSFYFSSVVLHRSAWCVFGIIEFVWIELTQRILMVCSGIVCLTWPCVSFQMCHRLKQQRVILRLSLFLFSALLYHMVSEMD